MADGIAQSETTLVAKYGLRSAVLGFVAALLGGAITGVLSYASVKEQNATQLANTKQVIEAESSRSEQEFLRAERAEVYNEYLAASLELGNALDAYSHIFARAADEGEFAAINVKKNTEMFPSLRAAYSDWVAKTYQVQLVSHEADTAQEGLNDHLQKAYVEVEKAKTLNLQGHPEKTNKEAYQIVDFDFHSEAHDLRESFVEVIQAELGVRN